MSHVSVFVPLIIVLLIIIGYLMVKLHKTRQKSKQILMALDDIQRGNLNRRILADNNNLTDDICYKINKIAQTYKEQISQAALTEKTNRRLMTSLSHDFKTPLTTLTAYLDAIHSHTVTGEERDQYIDTAYKKVYVIKDYTDALFDWFKVNSNERPYRFESVDINEVSREIIADWIPRFEREGISYTIKIIDKELMVALDIIAYSRILNNLMQNSIQHSHSTQIGIKIDEYDGNVLLEVFDNGKGISANDLPHIFERLYKCDEARTTSSSGLGLAIAYELVRAHGGVISVESTPNVITKFSINMKKAR